MDLNEFSQELTSLINRAVKTVPVTYAIMSLDMVSFELKQKHLEMVNSMTRKEATKKLNVVIENEGN